MGNIENFVLNAIQSQKIIYITTLDCSSETWHLASALTHSIDGSTTAISISISLISIGNINISPFRKSD